MDVLADPFTAPYMQRALAAVVLLGVAGGLFGAWIALRRLAFFTHAVGTPTFPGLVVAGPAAIAPPLAAAGAALLYTAGLARLLRDGRLGADAATGLLLVAALAIGSILAGDVFEAGAGVDRLLFGTLLGVSETDLWRAGARRAVRARRLAAAGDARAGRRGRPAGGRRAARLDAARRAERDRAAAGLLDARAAGRRRRARARRGDRRALAGRRREPAAGAGDRGAGRRGVRRGRAGQGGGVTLIDVSGLVTGYGNGSPALSGVTFALGEGQALAVLGPNGGGKTTLLRVLLGELPVLAGSCRVAGRPAYVAQSGRARLDFPVSALDVVLMGAYARTPAWR